MQRCGAGIELRRFCPAIAERVSGTNHSCELRSDNTITCWGSNYYGQTDAPGGSFRTVTADGVHSCGLRADDNITCWGRIV